MYKILDAIVDEYIRTGEPIGSKSLQQKLDISVSPATIRNDMAALESAGYLDHPHTSAGRIPTIKGFRSYIERMNRESPDDVLKIDEEEKDRLDDFFETVKDESDEIIIESASRALAEITKCAIVTSNLTSKFSVITKVELIPTGKRMYVLLLVTSSGNIKNRVCRLSFDLTNEQLDFFKRFVHENLEGMNSDDIDDEYLEKISMAMGNYMLTLSPILKAVADLSKETRKKQILLEGEKNLITNDEIDKNELVSLIENKNEFTEILENAFSGINVMFSEENDTVVVQNSSMITGSFKKNDVPVGGFGVIGPLRLDYKRIIPYIEYFTDKVTNILSEESEGIEKEVNNLGKEKE